MGYDLDPMRDVLILLVHIKVTAIRLLRSAVVLKPATILRLHRLLVKR